VPRKTKKAYPTYTSGGNSGIAMAQPTSGTNHVKTVARGPAQVQPHPHHRLSGLALFGDCMAACKDSLQGFPILFSPKPTMPRL